jgi:hypothetical protein
MAGRLSRLVDKDGIRVTRRRCLRCGDAPEFIVSYRKGEPANELLCERCMNWIVERRGIPPTIEHCRFVDFAEYRRISKWMSCQKNPAKVRQRVLDWQVNNRDRYRARINAWRKKNREKVNARVRRWYARRVAAAKEQ